MEAPIRQKVITQPTVLNVYEKAEAQFLQGEDQTVDRGTIYLPAKYQNEVINKSVDVPGNTVTNRTFIQPVNRLIREEVKIESGPEVRKELAPIVQDTQVQNNNSTKYIQVPGQKIKHQRVVQPLYYRENVQLNIQDSQPRYVTNDPIVQDAQIEESSRTQTFNVPGRTVYSQQQVQPVVTNESVRLKFRNSPAVYRTNEAYELEPQINTSSSTKKYSVTHTVPEFHNHPVKVPVVHRIPVYQDVPVEVVLQEREEDVMGEVREI